MVSGGLPRETAAALTGPLAQEIIAPIGESYKYAAWSQATPDAGIAYRFAHDRLQQASYAMIPPTERPLLHDQIGRLILERSTPEQREERLFEIVAISISASRPLRASSATSSRG